MREKPREDTDADREGAFTLALGHSDSAVPGHPEGGCAALA